MNVLAFNGFIDLPWWGYVLVALVFTHLTILGVTIYLHRCQAHRALSFPPPVSPFFRLWLWLTTGMSTAGWTAVHRKHHAFDLQCSPCFSRNIRINARAALTSCEAT